jgi:hypothetical protein
MPESVPGVPGAEIHEVDFLPDTLKGAVRVAPMSVAKPGAYLRVMPGIGRFLARDGKVIEVCRDKDADPLAVNEFLFGAVRAALIYQRGGFALHGACLVPPGEKDAIAIAGPSGAGKSTLAGELARRGWSLLGDDLTAVYQQPEGLVAWPSRPGIKLWRDTCEGLQIDVSGLDRLPGGRDKYLLPVFLLDRTRSEGIVPIAGPSRLAVLTQNSYRRHFLAAMGRVQSHFELICALSEQVHLAYLCHSGSVSTCADLLEPGISYRVRDSQSLRDSV